MQKRQKHVLFHVLPTFFFLTVSCVSTGEITRIAEDTADEISNAILHVGIEQKATGKVGRYGFKAYIYLSDDPQIVGIDPREELTKEYGKEKLTNYTNSDHVRFGRLDDRGRQLGKLILADKSGDILKGTFWDSFDVTDYLKRFGNRRYYLAAVAKIDRETYAIVGLRCFLEVLTKGGKRIRSSEVYFLGRTESMNGYLARNIRNVGLEIGIDVPPKQTKVN